MAAKVRARIRRCTACRPGPHGELAEHCRSAFSRFNPLRYSRGSVAQDYYVVITAYHSLGDDMGAPRPRFTYTGGIIVFGIGAVALLTFYCLVVAKVGAFGQDADIGGAGLFVVGFFLSIIGSCTLLIVFIANRRSPRDGPL